MILSRLALLNGYTTLGNCEVNTAPFALGGLATTRPRFLVVVIRSAYPVRLRFNILPTLVHLPLSILVRLEVSVLLVSRRLGTAHEVPFFTSLTSLFIRSMLTVLMLLITEVLLRP